MTSITLNRSQVEDIITDMGLDPDDADSFWKMAKREQRDPGCLTRERQAYFLAAIGR